eukprot:jgi/Ulvmu1/2338/UM013_0186.1
MRAAARHGYGSVACSCHVRVMHAQRRLKCNGRPPATGKLFHNDGAATGGCRSVFSRCSERRGLPHRHAALPGIVRAWCGMLSCASHDMHARHDMFAIPCICRKV